MQYLEQFIGSLLAIGALAWIAHRLGLGGDVLIRDEAHARELAGDVIGDFEATEVTLDRNRTGAILRDGDGRVMIVRRHGAHFAGRLLDHCADCSLDNSQLTLTTHDRYFGNVTLDLGEAAQGWAASLRRDRSQLDA